MYERSIMHELRADITKDHLRSQNYNDHKHPDLIHN